MNKHYITVVILVGFILVNLQRQTFANEEKLHRNKRYLMFTNGGTFKLVIGIAVPVMLGSKQSMAIGVNFQYQYPLPTNITELRVWPKIINRSIRNVKDIDNERQTMYKITELLLESEGLNGRECLLRSICENAFSNTHHESNGLYGHLLHIALTPDYGTEGHTQPDLDPVYMDAKKAGQFGVDCHSLYSNCNFENGLLDYISVLDT